MATIYLYTELLVNIRQITVFAILPSNCNESTQIHLDSDQRIRLSHEGEESVVEIPCPVITTSVLKIPEIPTRELSFRLGIKNGEDLILQRESDIGSSVPWPASVLQDGTIIACRSCDNLLVTNVTVWKDLPTGGWADMMDLWHCHKPDLENGKDGIFAGSTKGYAAAHNIGPVEGTGLVDVSHFLFAESDCEGVKVCWVQSIYLGQRLYLNTLSHPFHG